MQKIEKYWTVKAVGPEQTYVRTYARTNEQTHESEFIGSLSDKSGEQKNSQNCQFWPKNGQILATNGQILAISELSRHMHYDFLKEDHKGSFHTKNYENL